MRIISTNFLDIVYSSRNNHFLIFAFISFSHYSFGQEITMPEREPTVKKQSIESFEIRKGRFIHKFVLSNEKEWPVHLSIPEIKEGYKVPLIIALHWAGSRESYLEYSTCLAFPALEFLNAIIVAPSSNFGNWVHRKNEKKVIGLIKRLIKYWPIDKEKIIITGYSNGGIGSWEYAKKYPKRFAAVLPVSGHYEPHKMKVPAYILHGENDDLFNVSEVESAIEKSKKKGSLIHFKALSGFSHYSACSYVDALSIMAKKMQKELFTSPE